jgi:hypothetical protein
MDEVKKEKVIIVFKESLLQSILSDAATFGIIILSFAVNYYFVDGNNWVDGILTIMLIFWLLSSGSKRKHEFYSVKDVVSFLEDKPTNSPDREG